MNQSDQLDQLAPALAAAQASLNAAKKDKVNPHFKSQYATLQSVWDSAREVLAPNGLSVIQTFEKTDGKLMDIRTTLLHKSGQWIAGVLSLAPQQANPQGIGSAITYGRRYALAAILGIVADEDDDGNQASVEHPEPKKVSTPQRVAYIAPTSSGLHKPTAPTGWRGVLVPKFIKKYAGATMGEMEGKDVLWWAENYVPKEFKGAISEADIAFRKALDVARDDINGILNEPEQTEEIPF